MIRLTDKIIFIDESGGKLRIEVDQDDLVALTIDGRTFYIEGEEAARVICEDIISAATGR